MPVVLGHEGAGVVSQARRGRDRPRGRRPRGPVVGAAVRRVPAMRGRAAVAVRAGRERRRARRRAARRHLALGRRLPPLPRRVRRSPSASSCPRSGAVKIRDDAPLDVVAIVGCAVATGVGAVRNTAGVPPGATVARDRLRRRRAVRASRARGSRRPRGSSPATSTRPSSRSRRGVGATRDRARTRRRAAPTSTTCSTRSAGSRRPSRRSARSALGGAAVIVGLPPTGRRRASTRSRSPRPTSASSAPTTARSIPQRDIPWLDRPLHGRRARPRLAHLRAGGRSSEAADALEDLAAGRALRTLLITTTQDGGPCRRAAGATPRASGDPLQARARACPRSSSSGSPTWCP